MDRRICHRLSPTEGRGPPTVSRHSLSAWQTLSSRLGDSPIRADPSPFHKGLIGHTGESSFSVTPSKPAEGLHLQNPCTPVGCCGREAHHFPCTPEGKVYKVSLAGVTPGRPGAPEVRGTWLQSGPLPTPTWNRREQGLLPRPRHSSTHHGRNSESHKLPILRVPSTLG